MQSGLTTVATTRPVVVMSFSRHDSTAMSSVDSSP